MQSQKKTLRSGAAARIRSANVRSAGTARAVVTATSAPSSTAAHVLLGGALIGCGAEHDARIEDLVASHEPARHVGERAGVDDEPELLARRIGNRDENRVRARPDEDRLDLHQSAQNGDALQPPAREARLVVDEADDLLAAGLAQLAEQASAAATRADDQRAPAPAASGQGRDGPHERTLPEARRPDEDGADEGVDDEDAA